MEYQLELKQIVDFPRCRIYRMKRENRQNAARFSVPAQALLRCGRALP